MKRRSTDPRFTVETPRSRGPAVVVLALLVAAMAWSIHESMVGDLAPPYTSTEDPVDAEEPGGAGGQATEPAPYRGNLTGVISSDDYPADALDRGEQGTVEADLVVSEQGRVLACKILSSSGSESLDRATCNILTKRTRFTPAIDPQGRKVTGTFTQRITWRIEG
jgi:protein TonB